MDLQSIWSKFQHLWSTTQVDDTEVQKQLDALREQLPVPVFWLLGKTQSGKTSIIRALTGSSRAEIGTGLRPCTRTASLYSFPSEDDCLMRFLDTRGLGEAAYDPAEDLAQFQTQAHLLIVVMKAMDHAQAEVLGALKTILREQPRWPVLVVQSCLHEGYRSPTDQHPQPYPFDADPWPASVPEDLARSLLKQRKTITEMGIDARFVTVDFTLPEDGYEPADYGREALWSAIEAQLPLGLRAILQESDALRQSLRDLHYQTALPHIASYSMAAAAAATFPIPLMDIPLVIAIQARMCQTIAGIYHQELTTQRLTEIMSGLGIGFIGRMGTRELAKLIPGVGSAVAAAYASASTYALGIVLCMYFSRLESGLVPDKDEFQKLYDQFFEEGKAKLRNAIHRLKPVRRLEGPDDQTD